MKDIVYEIFWRVIIFSCKIIPVNILYFLVKNFNLVIMKKYYEKVFKTLKFFLSENGGQEKIEKLAKKIVQNILWMNIERFLLVANSNKENMEIIHIEGEENLYYVLKKNKGIIAVVLHSTNLSLIVCMGGLLTEKKLYIYGQFPTKPMGFINAMEKKFNIKFVRPKENIINELINLLIKGEAIIGLTPDVYKENGIPISFFNKSIKIPIGTALMAIRTGASILPIEIVQENNLKYKIIFGEPIIPTSTDESDQNLEYIVQRIGNFIENFVTRFPDQYQWWHFYDFITRETVGNEKSGKS